MSAYQQDPTAQGSDSSAPADPDPSAAPEQSGQSDQPGQSDQSGQPSRSGPVVPDTAPTEPNSAFDDPGYRTAVVDLLGVLAYGELTAFERLAEDAKLAPTLEDKAALATLAVTEFQHFQRLRDRLAELGDPVAAMEPFRQPVDAFHAHTAPSDWLEGLVKAYVGDGIATDFYREVAAYVDAETRTLVFEVLEDSGYAEFVVDRVGRAIAEDPKIAGRLALWGRRLVGEALSQAQRVAAERDALTSLLVGGTDRPGMDLAAIGRMFARLTAKHTERMASLGLQA